MLGMLLMCIFVNGSDAQEHQAQHGEDQRLNQADKQFEGDEEKLRAVVQQTMQHWLGDTDFAGVRGPKALANLPEAERQDWQKLWADVKELFAKAGGKSSPQEK